MMDDIDRSQNWWLGALNGVRGPIDADNPMTGKYRWVWKDKRTGSTTMGVVAYWYDTHDSTLRCQVDGKDVDDLRARERWPHDSRRPISDDVFYAFRDQGVWIDVDQAAQKPAAVTDNPAMVATPHTTLALEITAAKASSAKYDKVESDEEMVLAQSLRGKLQELASQADKLRVDEKEPSLSAGREVDAKWMPMVRVAKATADAIRKAMQDWNDFKLEQAAKTQMADNAAPNAPPPSTQIRGGGSRAASVSVKPRVTGVDLDKAFVQFRLERELSDLFFQLAQRAIDAGIPCEAATVEQKSSIR